MGVGEGLGVLCCTEPVASLPPGVAEGVAVTAGELVGVGTTVTSGVGCGEVGA